MLPFVIGGGIVMGLSFITEGAIPFAASDPLHVIPSCVVGSAVAGALSVAGMLMLGLLKKKKA